MFVLNSEKYCYSGYGRYLFVDYCICYRISIFLYEEVHTHCENEVQSLFQKRFIGG